MPTSSSGFASSPSSRRASSSRLRSGMRAAWTRTVLDISSPVVGAFGSEIYRVGRTRKPAKFRPMAVTAGQEYGLFIGGGVVEPAPGEIRARREPATGEPLARAAMAGEADIDRAV